MPATPPRRTEPAPHVLAHIDPLEKALRSRADALEKPDEPEDGVQPMVAQRTFLAAELRALADELHYW